MIFLPAFPRNERSRREINDRSRDVTDFSHASPRKCWKVADRACLSLSLFPSFFTRSLYFANCETGLLSLFWSTRCLTRGARPTHARNQCSTFHSRKSSAVVGPARLAALATATADYKYARTSNGTLLLKKKERERSARDIIRGVAEKREERAAQFRELRGPAVVELGGPLSRHARENESNI